MICLSTAIQKGFLLFILITLSIASRSDAQSNPDSLVLRQKPSWAVLKGGKKLKPDQLLGITRSHPEAYALMRKAKGSYDGASIFSFIGGFMIGWPLGTALAGGDAAWELAGIGLGVSLISVPFYTSYKKHATQAVTLYNQGAKDTGMNDLRIDIGAGANGLALKATF